MLHSQSFFYYYPTISGENPFESQNKLLAALVSDTKSEYFRPIEIDEILTENAKPSTYGTHAKYVPRIEGENSHVEHIITAPTTDMIYMYFPSSYRSDVRRGGKEWFRQDSSWTSA